MVAAGRHLAGAHRLAQLAGAGGLCVLAWPPAIHDRRRFPSWHPGCPAGDARSERKELLMNTITLIGTIQGPMEIRYTRDGVAQTTLHVAHARSIRNSQSDNDEGEVHVFEVICHAELAENVALSLDTKMLVQVTGSITYLSRTDDEGEVQRRVVIDASDVAPSLRLATAEVIRTERRHPSGV